MFRAISRCFVKITSHFTYAPRAAVAKLSFTLQNLYLNANGLGKDRFLPLGLYTQNGCTCLTM